MSSNLVKNISPSFLFFFSQKNSIFLLSVQFGDHEAGRKDAELIDFSLDLTGKFCCLFYIAAKKNKSKMFFSYKEIMLETTFVILNPSRHLHFRNLY